MRPIYLSIQGINSFIEKQEINFDRLSVEGLFCICGATGSGKTTILDSIVLALYGRGGRGRLGDYINLSSEFGRIEFEFKSEEIVYRVERTFYKATSKASSCILMNKTESKVLADQTSEADSKLREIIGLPREEFTQIAIIEQGKFSEFLSADKKDRNAVVGNLFRLNRFKGLSTLFNSKLAVLNERERNIMKNMAECADASREKIEQLCQEREIEQRNKIETTAQMEECRKEIERETALKIEYENVIKAKEAKAIKEREMEGIIAKLREGEAKKAKINAYEEEADNKRKRIEEENRLYFELEGMKNTYKMLQSLESKSVELSNNISKLEINAKELSTRYSSIISDMNTQSQRLKGNNEEAIQIYYYDKEVVSRIVEKIIANEIMSEDIELARTSFERLNQRARERVAEFTRLNQQIAINQFQLAKNMQDTEEIQEGWRKAVSESAVLRTKREEMAKKLIDCRQELKRQEISNSAESIRKALKDGDICPVCNNTVHINNEDYFSKRMADRVSGEAGITELEGQIVCMEGEIDTIGKEIISVEARIAAAATRIENNQKQQEAISATIDEAENLRKSISVDILDSQRLSKLLDLFPAILEDLGAIERLYNRQITIKAELEQAISNEERLKNELESVSQEGAAMRAVLEEKTGGRDLFELQKEISDSITKNTDFVSRFDKGRQEIELELTDLKNKSLGIEGELRSIAITADREVIFDLASFVEKEGRQKKLEEGILEHDRKIIKLEYDIRQVEQQLARKEEGEKELKKNTELKDDIARILKILKGDRFLEYVAEEYILRFTESASIILSKISSGKYTLVYQDGSFYVRDFLMGNELRKTSTLSGGETFLASLSLAVAITEGISEFKSFEFFFLDEGFGTLDTSSIEVVYEALLALSKETLVGIVTHRGELVEKISTRLNVIAATDERGTRIE